jgi:hypothetical protein
MDSIFIFLDRIYRIDGIFFACGERPFGRRPSYPDDPVDPVQLLFKDKNPFLFFAVLRYSLFDKFRKVGVSFLIKLTAFQAGGWADT